MEGDQLVNCEFMDAFRHRRRSKPQMQAARGRMHNESVRHPTLLSQTPALEESADLR